jgi:leucyl/phenylalanyl-tRNA--protein transferase
MQRCSSVKRVGQEGTWIMPEMIDAYTTLHQLGYAHSVEVWEGDQLVGGLYGIALGKIFFGESMFAEKPNASKVGFVTLAQHLDKKGFLWIDCQQDTPHMRTLGADLVEEDDFLAILRENHAYIV